MQQTENAGWFYDFLHALEALPVADAVRTSVVWFPALETIHVLAIVFVLGSIARVDLRLLGVISRNEPISRVSAEMLPWTWASFAVALVTGVLLFTAHAVRYAETIFFDVKMVLLALIAANMIYFEFVTYKSVGQWDRAARPPARVRFAGAASLIMWLGVITAGRYIGFV